MSIKIRKDQTPNTAAVASLAWPLAVNALMLHGIVIVDTYLVSSLGEEALAAMAVAGSISGLLVGVLFALSRATQILVAQGHGAQNNTALRSTVYCGLVLSALATAAGLILVWFFGERLLVAYAPTLQIANAALSYLSVFFVVVVCETVSQTLTCLFNGAGKTRIPLYSHLLEMPLNVAASWVLIFGHFGLPELGLMGAATGSALAAAVRMIFLVSCFFRFFRPLIHEHGWAEDSFFRSLIRHVAFTLPIAGTFVSVTLANTVSVLLYARLSINQFAAMTVILPWIHVTGTLVMSWAQATGIFVGQLLGRRVPDKDLDAFLRRTWYAVMTLAAVVSLVNAAAVFTFEQLYSNLQPETLSALTSFLPVLLILNFPKSSNAICGNTLRAGGDTVYVMNIFVVSQWLFRLPLTAVFILYLNLSVTWVFSLFLFEELVKFPLFHQRFLVGKWKRALADRGKQTTAI